MTTLDECKIADALTDIGSGPNVGLSDDLGPGTFYGTETIHP